MGLIEIRVGNGTYVRGVSLLPYIESLITLISSRLKTREENILKLWEVRKILEAGSVSLACSRMTPQRDLYRRRYSPNFRMIHSPQQALEGHKKIFQALGKGNRRESLKAMEEHLEKEENAFREVLKVRKKRTA